MRPPLPRTSLKKASLAGHTPAKRLVLDGDAFLRAEVAHHRHLQRGVRQGVRLDPVALRVGLQQRHARAQPRRGDAVRMQQHHAAGPVTAAAVSPQAPTAPSPARDGPTSRRDRRGTSETRRRSRCAGRTTSGSRPSPAARRTGDSSAQSCFFASACQCRSYAPVSPDLHDPSPQPC